MEKCTTAERLVSLMRDRHLRQVDILDLCQPYAKKYNVRIEKNDISAYVNGKYLPAQHKLSILAMALNVSEAWLMGYDVPMERRSSQNQTETSAEEIARRILNLSPENRARILERLQVLEEEEASAADAQV